MPRGKHREILVNTGLELILENGFEATGVQEITAASGVPKGSFYNYFGSKEEFGVEVLKAYGAMAAEQVRSRLGAEQGGSPLGRLDALLASWIADLGECGYERGCLAGQLCQEMAGKSGRFQQCVDGLFARIEAEFAACLRDAQGQGEIEPEVDTDAVAAFFYNSWQGAVLRMKARQSSEPLEQARRMLFDTVLARASA